ncbi:MAG: hypothetical protein FJ104_01995 [Deltaproteobacteria bacterium]|nr:hypothetical protein [Deltaproteobacteria bacterium]
MPGKAHLRVRQRGGGYTEVEKVEALVLLLAAGGDCIDDIRTLAADEGLCRLLSRQLPAADTRRLFLYEFHDESLIERARRLRPSGTVAFIPAESEPLAGLARVNVALVHAIAA